MKSAPFDLDEKLAQRTFIDSHHDRSKISRLLQLNEVFAGKKVTRDYNQSQNPN